MVKTLNVRGLNDYSSEVCNFLQDIESSFLDVIKSQNASGRSRKGKKYNRSSR